MRELWRAVGPHLESMPDAGGADAFDEGAVAELVPGAAGVVTPVVPCSCSGAAADGSEPAEAVGSFPGSDWAKGRTSRYEAGAGAADAAWECVFWSGPLGCRA